MINDDPTQFYNFLDDSLHHATTALDALRVRSAENEDIQTLELAALAQQAISNTRRVAAELKSIHREHRVLIKLLREALGVNSAPETKKETDE